MSKLPAETLIEIFKLLHLQQKLECMLVCRAWAQILRDSYLFETIAVSATSSLKSFYQHLDLLFDRAKNGSRPGKNCRRLMIDCANYSKHGGISGVKFAIAFPNLTFLRSASDIIFNPKARSLRSTPFDPDPFAGWRKNLEFLIDEGCDKSSGFRILATGVFSRLTTLTVPFEPNVYKRNTYKWFSDLKNAPALTMLSTNAAYLSIDDLEELHRNAPKLSSLTLSHGFLTGPSDRISLDVIPTEKMRVFNIIHCLAGPDRNPGIFLQYAKMKYPNLDEFSFYELNCRNTFGNDCNVISDSVWAEFIPAVGPNLSKFSIKELYKSNETLDLIEKYMVRLTYLDVKFFHDRRMLQKVVLNQAFPVLVSLSLHHLPPFLKMVELKELVQLKELSLDFSTRTFPIERDYPIEIDDIVKKLPKNIDTLCLRSAKIILTPTLIQDHSSIVNLKLYNCKILDKDIPDFVAQHFPRLKSLIMDGCILNSRFELPNHHLDHVEITPAGTHSTIPYHFYYNKENVRDKELDIIHLQITTSNQTLTYNVPVTQAYYNGTKELVDRNDRPMQRILKASDPDDELYYFHFVCASVDTIYYCDHFLLL